MEEKILPRPRWLVQRVSDNESFRTVKKLMENLSLHTVCQSADCPNMGECFGHHTATFLILGGTCTRCCRFCAVAKGVPEQIDPQEPENVAEAVYQLGLRHVVITSVTRDDLVDGGAAQFAKCIYAVRSRNPNTTIEVLTPDFKGNIEALDVVLAAEPTVFNHNLETVPRLYRTVRPIADYEQSLRVLAHGAAYSGTLIIKTGLMVGLGETVEEMTAVFRDIHRIGVGVLTVGQYLRPSKQHIPVAEYVRPEAFKEYEKIAYEVGLSVAVCGPLVRSSYQAGLIVDQLKY